MPPHSFFTKFAGEPAKPVSDADLILAVVNGLITAGFNRLALSGVGSVHDIGPCVD